MPSPWPAPSVFSAACLPKSRPLLLPDSIFSWLKRRHRLHPSRGSQRTANCSILHWLSWRPFPPPRWLTHRRVSCLIPQCRILPRRLSTPSTPPLGLHRHGRKSPGRRRILTNRLWTRHSLSRNRIQSRHPRARKLSQRCRLRWISPVLLPSTSPCKLRLKPILSTISPILHQLIPPRPRPSIMIRQTQRTSLLPHRRMLPPIRPIQRSRLPAPPMHWPQPPARITPLPVHEHLHCGRTTAG